MSEEQVNSKERKRKEEDGEGEGGRPRAMAPEKTHCQIEAKSKQWLV